MSRSVGAMTEPCALVGAAVRGAGRRARRVYRGRLEHRRVWVLSPSIGCLLWVVVVAVPLVSAPAVLASPGGNVDSKLGRGFSSGRTHSAGVQRTARGSRGFRRPGGGGMVLASGSGYGIAGGSARVRALQVRLDRGGFASGRVDGLYGPVTEQAVRRFQAAHGLVVDGVAGPRTLAVLRASAPVLFPGSGYVSGGSGVVRGLQVWLVRAGFSPGPVDGLYGPLTEQAVRRYQSAHGLRVDGVAGRRTFAELLGRRASRHGSRRHGLRPARSSRRPSGVSSSRNSRPAAHRPRPGVDRSHPTSGSVIPWLVLGALLAAGLLLSVGRAARRRRGGRFAADRGRDPQGGSVVPQPIEIPIALAANGDLAGAEAAFSAAREPGPHDDAFQLGLHLEEQGHVHSARRAYRVADQAGHPAAACNLGVLLENQGDLEGARAAYQRADERGDPNGSFNLGALLEELGDPQAAQDAYRRADQQGHSAAACNLGVLLETQGDLDGAQAAYQRADDRGDPNGSFNLGALQAEQHDPTHPQNNHQQPNRPQPTQPAGIAQSGSRRYQNPSQPTTTPPPKDRTNN
jgi:peptidoglycan hydrolase-like protein with peptidoglycan-binding domain